MRRTVHDGALRVENGVHAVVRDTLANFLLGSATAVAAAAGIGGGRSVVTESTVTLLTIFLMGVTKGRGREAHGARRRPPRGERRERRREGHARRFPAWECNGGGGRRDRGGEECGDGVDGNALDHFVDGCDEGARS